MTFRLENSDLLGVLRKCGSLFFAFAKNLKKSLNKFPSDSLIRGGWPAITLVLRLLSSRRSRSLRKIKSLTIVQESPRTKLGQNLDDAFVAWALEAWPDVPVKYSNQQELGAVMEPQSCVLLCYSWLQDLGSLSRSAQLLEVIKLSSLANRRRCPVLVPLPDTFKVKNSFFAAVIVGLCEARILLLQNTNLAARNYGLSNTLSPVFWTWSSHVVEEWTNPLPLGLREAVAAVAISGDPRRSEIRDLLAPKLLQRGYTIRETGSLGSYEEYRKFAREVPIVVTTCWLQERFIEGPSWYRKRLNAHTVTGRVWEAFASKSLLICNENSEMALLGFAPGKHYVALPAHDEFEHWGLPSASQMEVIAEGGHAQFLRVRSRTDGFLKNLISSD